MTAAPKTPARALPEVPRTGKRKAAILAISLGPERAAEIFKHLRQDEQDELVLEIAGLNGIDSAERDEVMEEFYHSHLAQDYIAEGGLDYARDVLERALGGAKAMEIIGRLSSFVQVAPFEFLRRTDPAQITNFIQHEHPQTIALILAYLPAEVASGILTGLPERMQSDVAMRIAVMDRTQPEVIRQVEAVMERKLSSILNQDFTTAGGVLSLVDMLNLVDRTTERHILESLDETSPELAEEVRKLMFVFEDVLLLDDRSIQQLLKELEVKELALALKGTSEDVQEKVYANMSQRAGTMLKEDIAYMGPQRRRSIEEAQQKIVSVVRRLEESGKIVIARGGGDDELVS
ncbi:MAG: flagellar motor switch protein FliG [Thermoleophilia bacterium]|nr:flagellar motor switch protein FliG [Thermoleophilia bacterium]